MKRLRDKMDRWVDRAKGWARHLGGLGRSERPDAAQRAPAELGDNFPVIDLEVFRIGLRESMLTAMMQRDPSEWERFDSGPETEADEEPACRAGASGCESHRGRH